MKTKNLLTITAVSAGLAMAGIAQAHEEKHEEQNIHNSDVPAAVQQAAQAEAKGQKIIRWEKEAANYEAVVNQNGKEMGITIDSNGKVLSKHSEAKEHKGEGSRY
jgi:Peptidase propeptide and YPEB domain